MSRKTLLGIKERAERLAGRDPSSPAEPLLWLAVGVGALAVTVLAVTRRLPAPYRLGAAATGAGLLALALFRGFPNPVYAILVTAAITGAVLIVFRPAEISPRRTAVPVAGPGTWTVGPGSTVGR
jgi:hypothetical protein